MRPARVRYVSMDGLTEGVGASQVLAYAERLSERGVHLRLHTFERHRPPPELVDRVRRSGVDWRPSSFGRNGPRGGAQRVLRAAAWARTGDLVHARSDLCAAAAVLARTETWVWDVRSLWADQRIALGQLTPGSAEERVLRRVEAAAATRSSAVVALTSSVLPVLDQRHGGVVSPKATVITTCVDTKRFSLSEWPQRGPTTFLLAGTLNRYYDVPAMRALVLELRRRRPTRLRVLAPGPTPWDALLRELEPEQASSTPAGMPAEIAASHVGLSVCRDDAGVSLTAAMPTKIGEFLASGRPVVVNEGLEDAAALVREHGAGVVLGAGEHGTRAAADELEGLLADGETPSRCRRLALLHFDLDAAVERLVSVYEVAAEGTRPQATQ